MRVLRWPHWLARDSSAPTVCSTQQGRCVNLPGPRAGWGAPPPPTARCAAARGPWRPEMHPTLHGARTVPTTRPSYVASSSQECGLRRRLYATSLRMYWATSP
jgi:hypothetical protein